MNKKQVENVTLEREEFEAYWRIVTEAMKILEKKKRVISNGK